MKEIILYSLNLPLFTIFALQLKALSTTFSFSFSLQSLRTRPQWLLTLNPKRFMHLTLVIKVHLDMLTNIFPMSLSY